MTPVCTLLVVKLEPHWFAATGNLALTDVVAGKENSCCKMCVFSTSGQNSVKRTDFFSHASLKRTKWLLQNAHWEACREKCSSRGRNRGKSWLSKGKRIVKGRCSWVAFTTNGSGNVCARGFSSLLKQQKDSFSILWTLIENALVAESNISSWSWEISSATNIIVIKTEPLKEMLEHLKIIKPPLFPLFFCNKLKAWQISPEDTNIKKSFGKWLFSSLASLAWGELWKGHGNLSHGLPLFKPKGVNLWIWGTMMPVWGGQDASL